MNGVVEGKLGPVNAAWGLGKKKSSPDIDSWGCSHGWARSCGGSIQLFQVARLSYGRDVHVVVNNQIGFTTDPTDARSSLYCTDVAKIIEAPIFPQMETILAVAMVAELALEYRQKFQEDVVIDINCYRKHGHNEADDPAFTQPILYQRIKHMPSISSILTDQLVLDGDLDQKQSDEIHQRLRRQMEATLEKVRTVKKSSTFEGSVAIRQIPYDFASVDTSVPKKDLEKVAHALTSFPDDFNLNSKIKRQIEAKAKNFKAGRGIDWAMAEQLAFGSLMLDGTPASLRARQ